MPDNQRIDDLRRRVQKDPASIAFAQLAEELRRAGEHQESVDVCRAGLQIHPAYLSARVTLGRALLELNDLPDAQAELELVLKSAPENLAAIRGLGEIHHRRGELPEALAQYRAALALARNDPDLQETVDQLSRQVEPQKPAPVDDGLSFDQMQNELLKLAPTPAPWEMPVAAAEPVAPSVAPWEVPLASAAQVAPSPVPWEMPLAAAEPLSPPPVPWEMPLAPMAEEPQAAKAALNPWEMPREDAPAPFMAELAPPDALADIESLFVPTSQVPWEQPEEEAPIHVAADLAPAPLAEIETLFVPDPAPPLAQAPMVSEDPMRVHAERTVAALEQWLAAIHVARPERSA